MKTPDEIKREAQALREVSIEDLIDFTHVVHSMFPQAADLVESLLTEIEQVKRERDAIEKDFAHVAKQLDLAFACEYCMHYFLGYGCRVCNFEWRGYQLGMPEVKADEN